MHICYSGDNSRLLCLMSQHGCLKVFYMLIILISHIEFMELEFQFKLAWVKTSVIHFSASSPYFASLIMCPVVTESSTINQLFQGATEQPGVGLAHRAELLGAGSSALGFAFAICVKSLGTEQKLKEHQEEENASLASKVLGKGQRWCQPSPCSSLAADSGQELLQTASALKPVIKWLEWVAKLCAKQGEGGHASGREAHPAPAVSGELSWALRWCWVTALTTVLGNFSAMLLQFRKLLWCYTVFVPEILVEAFYEAKSLRLFLF